MEKVQGHVRHLLWDRAQDEEGGDGGQKFNKEAKQGWRLQQMQR